MSFVHLHTHTSYSLLQGCLRPAELVQKAKEFGMPSVAITDTHQLFGAVDFYLAAKAVGIKPIIGCEVQYAPDSWKKVAARPGDFKPTFYHLVLLCKDHAGYQNLSKLLSKSYLRLLEVPEGERGDPVVTFEDLKEFSKGLIVLSGCMRGELSYLLHHGQEEEAKKVLQNFKTVFGEDFYLEIQSHGFPNQDRINDELVRLGKLLSIETVATQDCHYLEASDADAHEVLQCIETGRNLAWDRPKSLVPSDFCFHSPDRMREIMHAYPGAYEQTLKIAEKCNVEFKFKDEEGKPIYHLPKFETDGDLSDYFKSLSQQGLERRLKELKITPDRIPYYQQRLDGEIQMILKTGFAGYFLIVADFINWAKDRKIPVGPGRGSGAGSLVAYSLRITDIDPIGFNLLFERFINPERISMPDFDVDFCQERRGEVIQYVSQKYGSSNVAQIITFGKLQARAVIKDVGRVLGLSFAETDQLTKLFPDELNITIDQALGKEPELKRRAESDPKLKKVVEYALKLEGLSRNAGVHAAGVIITERPIVEYCPLFVGKEGSVVVQFDKDFAEKIGLVKFDFLGLKTLTVIDTACQFIRERIPHFQLEEMDYNDPKVYELIGEGDTDGVFQVESSGMKDLCTRLKPGNVEDLTAINALYRPGPLGSGMVDDFIERKHGRKPIVYDTPLLETILKDTYGVILYQEQVMQIARDLAGYSLGQADMLRRAMGKKKASEMAEQKEIFVKGATERGLKSQTAIAIFDLMAKFAEYGFNKSHSAAYAVLTYQTAFLKTHYPAEFMASLLTTEMGNTDKMTRYISDARSHGLTVLAPDCNSSQKRFRVESPTSIRFGLEAVKGVGGAAVEAILEARAQSPFRDIVDFCERVALRKVNKKVLESLILSGAMDQLSKYNRPSLVASIDSLLELGVSAQEEKALGQASLFADFESTTVRQMPSRQSLIKELPDWPIAIKLLKEKQVVGFFVSGHPMDGWQSICESWLGCDTEKIQTIPPQTGRNRKEAKIAGLMTETKEITTKKGQKMAFATLEDLKGKLELIFFPESYASLSSRLKEAMEKAEPVIATGEVENKEGICKLFVKSLEWAEEAHQGRVKQVHLRLNPKDTKVEQLRELKRVFIENRGNCPVHVFFETENYRAEMSLPEPTQVKGSAEFVKQVSRIFGKNVVELRE